MKQALMILTVAVTFAAVPATSALAAPAKVPCSSIGNHHYNCSFRVSGNGTNGGSPVLNGNGTRVGYLHSGTNFVICQQTGRTEHSGRYYNNVWAYTEADNRKLGWVNAVWAHGGDNNGAYANVPSCKNAHGLPPHSGTSPTPTPKPQPAPAPHAPAKVPCSKAKHHHFNCGWRVPGNGKSGGSPVLGAGGNLVGYLHKGPNYVVCQRRGRRETLGGFTNNVWAYTVADNRRHGWVSALWARGGDNDGTFAHVPGCPPKLGHPPLQGKTKAGKPPVIKPAPAPIVGRRGAGTPGYFSGVAWNRMPSHYGFLAELKLNKATVHDAAHGSSISQELWVATDQGSERFGHGYKGPYIVGGRTRGCGGRNVTRDFLAQQDTHGEYGERCYKPFIDTDRALPISISWRRANVWGVSFAHGDAGELRDAGGTFDSSASAFVGLESNSKRNSASGSVNRMARIPATDPREGIAVFQSWNIGSVSSSGKTFTRPSNVDWDTRYYSFHNSYRATQPAPKPPPKPRYVALGDSFSSGEGAGSYYGAANGLPARCHRSSNAYAVRLARRFASRYRFTESRDFLACSGAQVYAKPAKHVLGLLNDEIPRMGGPDIGAVTIGIGGNDAGFTDIITRCVVHQLGGKRCNKIIEQEFKTRLPTLVGNLNLAYSQIRAKAPYAKIVVVGYPAIFDERPTTTKFCGRSVLTRGARNNLRTAANQLDATIGGVAKQHGFTFVDPRAAFVEHRLCGRNASWIRSVLAPGPEKFHPSATGQRALTNAIRAPAGSPFH